MFVLYTYKDGGIMGYEEWYFVGVCSTQEKAEQMMAEFLAARLDKRFDCTIRKVKIDQIDDYFYDRELDKRFTLTRSEI